MTTSLGYVKVAVAGTPVPLSAVAAPAHRLTVQALPGNIGTVYLGVSSVMVKATGVGVIAILPKPAATGPLPTYEAVIEGVPKGVTVNELYLDADNATDGVVVSIRT